MKYKAVSTIEPDFLRITATGEYYFEDLAGFVGFIRSEALRADRSRVLIDCSSLSGRMTEGERFEGGSLIAKVFGPSLKAVLVLPSDMITKLGELAAVNRGAKFFVTSSEAQAIEWLLSV